MAKGFGKGANALTVWMIVFVALWLASTVFLVILYTDQAELIAENNRLREDNRKLIGDPERRSVTLFELARTGGPTVVGLLERARSELAKLALGDPTADVAAVQAKLDEFLRAVRSDATVSDPKRFQNVSYHQALTLLYEAYNTQTNVRKDLEARVNQLQGEVTRFAEAGSQQQVDFEQRAAQLAEQLKAVESARDAFRAERDRQIAEIQRLKDEDRLVAEADLTKERQRVAALETQMSQLRLRLNALQEKFGDLIIGPEELATARRPDGHILTAIPGDEVVYINLGARDKLVLGMSFAVYSPDSGIPLNGKSKAQIEVVSIDQSSAECKIVRHYGPGMILEGDLIANPAYDRTRAVRFVIAGDFDLDHDGVIDGNGGGVLAAIIAKWGGLTADDVNALTDFVILGVQPRRPRQLTEAAPEELARIQAMQQRYDHYQQVFQASRDLAVPTMTQPVFLAFLGFAGAI